MELFWTIFLIIISLFVLWALVTAYVVYFLTFRTTKKIREDNKKLPQGRSYQAHLPTITKFRGELENAPCEDIFKKARDGVMLHARYYHIADGGPVEIQFHGYKSYPFNDFCKSRIFCHDKGINTLMVDQRAHDKSGGKCLSFGIKERYDCLAWANYASERFGGETKIILSGVSMGAATVIMASNLPLPKNVVGIIADSPFSSPREILRKVCGEDLHYPLWLFYPFIYWGALLFGGFNINAETAENAARDCKVPLLIFHGEADGFVPCDMGRKIYDACGLPEGQKKLVTVAGADHVLCSMVAPEMYAEIVGKFKDEVLKTE